MWKGSMGGTSSNGTKSMAYGHLVSIGSASLTVVSGYVLDSDMGIALPQTGPFMDLLLLLLSILTLLLRVIKPINRAAQ